MLKSSTIEWFQRGSAGPEIVEWLIADLGIGSTLTAAQMYNKYENPKAHHRLRSIRSTWVCWRGVDRLLRS